MSNYEPKPNERRAILTTGTQHNVVAKARQAEVDVAGIFIIAADNTIMNRLGNDLSVEYLPETKPSKFRIVPIFHAQREDKRYTRYLVAAHMTHISAD